MYKILGVKCLFEIVCPASAFVLAVRDEARNPQRFIHVTGICIICSFVFVLLFFV